VGSAYSLAPSGVSRGELVTGPTNRRLGKPLTPDEVIELATELMRENTRLRQRLSLYEPTKELCYFSATLDPTSWSADGVEVVKPA
jgi:hypothetical protein